MQLVLVIFYKHIMQYNMPVMVSMVALPKFVNKRSWVSRYGDAELGGGGEGV